MNALDLFTQRRSVRAYLPTPVSEDLLGQIMTTARLAPSGANLQPGVFVAVRGTVPVSYTHLTLPTICSV